jgi:HAD superfamily hydrolase (TIGR01450 family)
MTLEAYQAILCDLDGCLISGETVLPGAAEFVAAYRDRIWIVSNNSTDTPHSLSARLHRLGLEISPDRIFLAGMAAIEHVAQKFAGRSVAIFGTAHLQEAAIDAGLRFDPIAPDVVILARDIAFDYHALTKLISYVRSGAELVVTNTDNWHPGPDGAPVPETGALLAAIVACLPDVAFTTVGKPQGILITQTLSAASCTAAETAFIGDNPRTDGEGAKALGIAFFQVGPHQTHLSDLLPGVLGPTV